MTDQRDNSDLYLALGILYVLVAIPVGVGFCWLLFGVEYAPLGFTLALAPPIIVGFVAAFVTLVQIIRHRA